jgi:hypothetical protein
MYDPPCFEHVGYVPDVTCDHVPAVPEVSVCAQPVVASKPFEKSVTGPPEAVPVKFLPVWLAPLIVTLRLAGENVYPLLLGVTVYVPLARPEIV